MKPRIAFFDFASCEGCQLECINFVQEFLDVVSMVDIVEFREAITDTAPEYDIAFIEGSITREKDIPRLTDIRNRSKVLIAIGACACTGGVNAIKNNRPLEQVRKDVYGDKYEWYETFPTRPVDAVVKVDGYIPGCPIDRNDFVNTVKALLAGKACPKHDYPVCVECRLKENECLLTIGKPCLGPITQGGCGAIDPTWGSSCTGCRGFVHEANVDSEKMMLMTKNCSEQDIHNYMTIFNSYKKEEK
jgi:coenzyme F420-reducing hydrogenase gamma subunit